MMNEVHFRNVFVASSEHRHLPGGNNTTTIGCRPFSRGNNTMAIGLFETQRSLLLALNGHIGYGMLIDPLWSH